MREYSKICFLSSVTIGNNEKVFFEASPQIRITRDGDYFRLDADTTIGPVSREIHASLVRWAEPMPTKPKQPLKTEP